MVVINMPKKSYIVESTDLGAEDLSLPPFQWKIEASSNADARTTFKRQMKSEFGVVEGKDYRIDSVRLDVAPKAPVKTKGTSKMGLKEAEVIIGNAARWEVVNMKKALSSMELLNTPEENERLEACKVWLRSHKAR